MSENILICATNWLGDGVMSMPAIQAYRRLFPEIKITILAKSKLVSLWSMHGGVDLVMELRDGIGGTIEAAGAISRVNYEKAFVFPNSFRSALIPFLAGVHGRMGYAGHARSWMFSKLIEPQPDSESKHQSFEYFQIMGIAEEFPKDNEPHLSVPESVLSAARSRLEAGRNDRRWVGILPGAARGSSKRWPADHFIDVGKWLVGKGFAVLVLGSASETDLCACVAGGIGGDTFSLAGQTSIPELAAMLSLCRVVVTNDSGGMHLAAAVGTNVAAIFGITDPVTTGPLGNGHRIILAEGVSRSRDIKRDSIEATQSLRSIKAESVCAAVDSLLQGV